MNIANGQNGADEFKKLRDKMIVINIANDIGVKKK